MSAPLALSPGTRLGPYEVRGPLGAGGMGEVYRARDTRLGRDVAVKVMRVDRALMEEGRERFEREARAIAALSHPNIVSIHDVGRTDGQVYAVMELLEGETLRVRLDRGALPWRKAVDVAAAVADGLAAAHAKGIVHRDLKPANVFLTADGQVKVLDFGLAKLRAPVEAEDGASPTLSQTEPGKVLGTVGYMSPEQVAGRRLDGRSDIFSLGCALYEMVGGQRPFARPSAAETMAAILNAEPPELDAVPMEARRLIAHCLEKDPDVRFQSARDLAFDLRALPGSTASGASVAPRALRRPRVAAVTGIAAALLLGIAVGRLGPRPASAPEASAVVALTPGDARAFSPALSPDGKFVAYKSSRGGRTDVWVRFIGGGPPANITAESRLALTSTTFLGGIEITPDGTGVAVHAGQPGTSAAAWGTLGTWIFPVPLGGPPRKLLDGAAGLRWSPDGQRVVFVRPNAFGGDAILTARADGQDERDLIPAAGGIRWVQPAWSHDGAYVYVVRLPSTANRTEIWRVPSHGGSPEPVVADAASPEPMPDGTALLYTRFQGGVSNIWWRPLRGGAERRLTTGTGGYLVERISRDGHRLVAEAGDVNAFLGVIGREAADQADPHEALTGPRSGDREPSVCGTTGQLAFTSTRNGFSNVWIADVRGGDARPLTAGTEGDQRPALSPDGKQVAFVSDRNGGRGVWLVSVEGGAPRRVVEADITATSWGGVSWSPDGQRLVYSASDGRRPRLWIVAASGGTPTLVPGVEGRTPTWSPSADVIAYFSTAEGVNDVGLRFTRPSGERVLPELNRSLITMSAMAWSHDGARLAVASGGAGIASPELWVVDLRTREYRRMATFPSYSRVNGIAWSPDNHSVIFGRDEYESRILLLDGIR